MGESAHDPIAQDLEDGDGENKKKHNICLCPPSPPRWSYTCVDLLSPVQAASVGGGYELLHLYLYKDEESQQDFYVDTVHLGKRPTTSNIPGTAHLLYIHIEGKCSFCGYDI